MYEVFKWPPDFSRSNIMGSVGSNQKWQPVVYLLQMDTLMDFILGHKVWQWDNKEEKTDVQMELGMLEGFLNSV